MSQSTELNLTSTQGSELNLTSSTFKANPYPAFARLRTYDPVHLYASTDVYKTWLITRYSDAEMVLRDERFAKDREHTLPTEQQVHVSDSAASVDDLFGLGLLKLDPPAHTRLRSLISLSFTPRMVEQWRGRIQQIADELIDAVEAKGAIDLIEEFAFPLPMRVITEMLGLPLEDGIQLHRWIRIVTDALDDPVAFQQASEQLRATYMYLCNLIERKRQDPADDLVSKLILAESAGDRLSERELVSLIFVLILTGYETTANLIGNGMLALITHTEQMALLQQDPGLIKTAVEEFLRYLSPVAISTFRWAREDVEIAGKQIHRGDGVVISLTAANRDEEAFAEADSLDITRRNNAHLAFGKGIHYCLGAPLARLEGEVAITTLLRRLPDLHLSVDPTTLSWRPGSTVMGMYHLPVQF